MRPSISRLSNRNIKPFRTFRVDIHHPRRSQSCLWKNFSLNKIKKLNLYYSLWSSLLAQIIAELDLVLPPPQSIGQFSLKTISTRAITLPNFQPDALENFLDALSALLVVFKTCVGIIISAVSEAIP
jgi:hypothetical protein